MAAVSSRLMPLLPPCPRDSPLSFSSTRLYFGASGSVGSDMTCPSFFAEEHQRARRRGAGVLVEPGDHFQRVVREDRGGFGGVLGRRDDEVRAGFGQPVVQFAPLHKGMDRPPQVEGEQVGLGAEQQHRRRGRRVSPNGGREPALFLARLLRRFDRERHHLPPDHDPRDGDAERPLPAPQPVGMDRQPALGGAPEGDGRARKRGEEVIGPLELRRRQDRDHDHRPHQPEPEQPVVAVGTPLQIGTVAFAGTAFTLADLTRAEAAAESAGGSPTRHKAVINVFLAGGPPHQDTFDLKPDAPAAVRGEFKPIKTNVPGVDICEVFPRLAKMADKLAILRAVVGAGGGHDGYQVTTGFAKQSLAALGGRPSLGSVLSKLHGPVDPSVPPFVGLAGKSGEMEWSNPGRPGFLGASAAAFRPSGPDLANMTLNAANKVDLTSRRKLLAGIDTLRRDIDSTGAMAAADAHTARALDVLLSSKLVDALDLSKEDPKVRARYGDGKPYQFQFDGTPTANEHFLMARRLIDAGARCVSMSYGRWDSHAKNFALVRDHGPKLDQGLSALIEDLDRSGRLADTVIAVWGEFGRSPRINKEAGRDHWPQVSCALLAGGGLKTGQVVGSTSRLGETAKDRPVGFGDVFATIYHALGVNPETATLNDPTGRPQHVTEGKAIRELV